MSDEQKSEPTVPAQGAEPNVEDKARMMGWSDKDKWRGDPEKWVDAETFVRTADEKLPVARAMNDKLAAELADLKRSVAEFKRHHEQTEQRAYQKALADIKAQQAAAIKRGDGDTWQKLEDRKEEVQAAAQASRIKPDQDPGFVAWTKENTWYTEDAKLREYADFLGTKLAHTEGIGGTNLLKRVEAEVREQFPHKFQRAQAQARAASSVEGGSPPPVGNGKKGYHDLPAEARTICDKWVKQGLLTREQYVKDFFG